MKKMIKKDWDKFFIEGGHCAPIKAFERNLIKRLPAKAKIVDLGCGEGLLGKIVGGRQYIGVDFSPFALGRASVHNSKAHFIEADINKLRPNKIVKNADIVFLRFVLAHSQNPKRLINQALGLLKPKGRLVVLSPLSWEKNPKDSKIKSISINWQDWDKLFSGLKLKRLYSKFFKSYNASLVGYSCRKK